MELTCRFYKNPFPDINDVVMVNVTGIEEIGVYVNLLEYNNQQGMMLMTELSRRRIRSINKLIRIGRNEVVVVIRVDRKKGNIDVSKRRALAEDITRCEEKFARGKTVHSILSRTAEILGLQTDAQFEELYEKTAWFYDEKHKQSGAAYDVFARAASNEHELDDCLIDEDTKRILLNTIRHRLTPPPVKCRADVEVACYGYEGIDAVKAALKEGLKESTKELPIKINLIAPPVYVVSMVCADPTEGLVALKKAIDRIKDGIESHKGIYKTKMQPKVVTDSDELALNREMSLIIQENNLVPDDDPDNSSENEDGGISGKLLGEEDAEPSTTTKHTTSQSNATHEDTDDTSDDNED